MKKIIFTLLLCLPVVCYADSQTTINGRRASGHIIEDEGVKIKQRPQLNFTGDGVSVADISGKTTVTIGGGGGAGSGTMTTVKEGGVQVGGADIVTLDFGAGFDVSEDPDTECNIVLDLTEDQVDLTTEVTGVLPDANVANDITIDLATLATTVTVSDDESTNDAHEIVFTTDNANLESDGTATYNPSTGVIATTGFAGALTGNVTGNADTCTTASAGDAAVDFFGAGVDAVTDATTCTDLEGTKLSITAGTLNCTETDPIVGAITGIVKADGGGNISAASAGTDYMAATLLKDIVAGVGLSGGANDVLPGADGDVTLTVDTTEIDGERTWGAADGASITWTWNLVANDPSMTFGPANVTSNAPFYCGYGSNASGELRILEDTDEGSNYASFIVPALAGNTTYTLPADDGDAGEQLQTNGSGILSWEAAGAAGGESLAATLAIGADANDLAITSLAKLEGIDNAVYVDLGNDTYANIAADAYVDLSTLDVKVQDNLQLDSDGAIIELGADQDVTLTHVADTGVQMELDDKIMFGDTAVFIHSDDDGYLDLDADTGIRLNGDVTGTGTITATTSVITPLLDAAGAEDMDYGSADVTDHTFTSDNGTAVILDGTASAIGANEIVDKGDTSSTTAAGIIEIATAAEIDTGTDATRAMSPDTFEASKRNIRWLVFNLVEAGTDCAVDTNIGGDWVSPIAGTILQDDSTPFYLYATNSTAGTTGTMVVDISLGGTSIMTTNKLDFDSTEKTTTTASTMPDLTDTTLAVGDILTIDIDSIHTTAAKGLVVYMAVRE